MAAEKAHLRLSPLLALPVFLLKAVELGHVAHHGDHHGHLPRLVKAGRAGDEGLFPGAEGLFQGDRRFDLQRAEGAGAVDQSLGHHFMHIFPHYLIRFQS